MKRKLIAMLSCVLVFVLVLGICLFSACGGTDPGTQPPGGSDTETPVEPDISIGSGNEEAAIRALLRGLTTDFSSAQANVQAMGKIGMRERGEQHQSMSVYAWDADLAASYGSESTVMMFDGDYDYNLRSDTANLADAMEQLKDDPMNSNLYYVNGNIFEKSKYDDSYYIDSYNADGIDICVDGIFNGAWLSDINELLGLDILSNWTFESLKEDIAALTVGEMLDCITRVTKSTMPFLLYDFGGIGDQFTEDTEFGELSVSDIFDALAGIIKALGVDYSRGGDLYEFLHWLLTDSFKIYVTENDQGSTLTVKENEIAKHVLDFVEDFRSYKDGNVNDAIKSMFNIDLRTTFDSVKNIVKGTMMVDDVLKIVSDVVSDYGLSYDQVISFIDSIVKAVTGDSDIGFTEEHKAYTVDEFIKDVSGNEMDYASAISTAEEYMDSYLEMPFGDFLNANSWDEIDEIRLLMSLTAEKAGTEFNVSFDKDNKLTKITAEAEVCFEYDITNYHMHFSGEAKAVIDGFGSTQITLPSDVEDESTGKHALYTTGISGDLSGLFAGKPAVISYENGEKIKKVEAELYDICGIDYSVYMNDSEKLSDMFVVDGATKTVTVPVNIIDTVTELIKKYNENPFIDKKDHYDLSAIKLRLVGKDDNGKTLAYTNVCIGNPGYKEFFLIGVSHPDGYSEYVDAIEDGRDVTFVVSTLIKYVYDTESETWTAKSTQLSDIKIAFLAAYMTDNHILIAGSVVDDGKFTTFVFDENAYELRITLSAKMFENVDGKLARLFSFISIFSGETLIGSVTA